MYRNECFRLCWFRIQLATIAILLFCCVSTVFAQDEFEGFPCVERTIGENEKKTYFQIGPKTSGEMPEAGWKVLFILPGGDGSADFHGFCRRIHMNALPDGYIAIQLVAHAWSDDDNRTVWPTEFVNPQKAEFTTETLIAESLVDVASHVEFDSKHVFALGWSSGGPPVYAASMTEGSPITGSFVAMSVFREAWMPDLSKAKEHPYFVFHSPDDWINIDEHARPAVKALKEAGATAKLQTYRGGHGWRDDPFGNIRKGVTWLEQQVEDQGDE